MRRIRPINGIFISSILIKKTLTVKTTELLSLIDLSFSCKKLVLTGKQFYEIGFMALERIGAYGLTEAGISLDCAHVFTRRDKDRYLLLRSSDSIGYNDIIG